MSNALRIEELKKKFDENPRRYFAPLANEYRKAGDLQQAISICQAHLPQQPGHMSGHIVYGQALFEARQFDQARTVFETALALDPENLIALRYLGDIAFELGDRAGARGWYTRVLETDPRNEEIAALMAAMGAEERTTSRESGASGGAVAADTAASKEPARGEPLAADSATAPSKVSTVPSAGDKPRETAGATTAADAELEKLFSRPPEPKAEAAATAETSTFSPLSGFGAPKPADAAPALERPAPSLAGATPVAQAASTPSTDVGARETGFVTETMADLYVKQGFHDRALDVYRQLVAQNPTDRGLRERMERVERELRSAPATRGPARDAATAGRGGPTVRQFLARFGTRGMTGRGSGVAAPPGGGPHNSGEFHAPHAARAGSGGSIDALFAGASPSREDVAAASTLADAFTAGPSATPPDTQLGGRPAHPAATELSLDSVFRDGAGVVSSRTSTVSYDQFFSQPAQASASSHEETTNTPPPAGGSDDIEQFNAWLQGLKKR
jgi:tetratricopeptide (TPR) repeat protein